jgi:hypothetical protein
LRPSRENPNNNDKDDLKYLWDEKILSRQSQTEVMFVQGGAPESNGGIDTWSSAAQFLGCFAVSGLRAIRSVVAANAGDRTNVTLI